ncbi:MAG: hypothetical protein OK454_05965 [Thaumarchaeota archaeon]|nr:hypothetical protein [Nitrososphaerota archaeon]
MNSSETSAKYSWPSSEQKEDIQDSGAPDEVDILSMAQGCPAVVDRGARRLEARLMVEKREGQRQPNVDALFWSGPGAEG